MLQNVLSISNESLKRQINYILNVLHSKEEELLEEEDDEEEEEFINEEDSEEDSDGIDDEETLLPRKDKPCGEDLLCMQFLASAEVATQEMDIIRSSMQELDFKKVYNFYILILLLVKK